MIFTEANLERLGVHYIGNKQNGGALLLSKQEQRLNEDLRERMREALLQRFTNCHERYSFYHTSELKYNEVYNHVGSIFADPANFYEQSVNIARHLFESSLHPKIKPGELYVARFGGVIDELASGPSAAGNGNRAGTGNGDGGDGAVSGDGEAILEAIGLFKAETRSLFADLVPGDDDLDLQLKEGVELARMDKGCLILNRGEDKGFELLIYDSNGKGEEAQYWKDKFLGVMIRQNEYLRTQDFLTLTKNYVTQQMPDDFEVSKTEQIDILNRSMDYFKTHGNFDRAEFETEVLHHEELIHSFRKFDEQHRRDNDLDPVGEFEISKQAVKKQARVFKSVIRLDKNFHIYVHGNRELIEKGYDEGRKQHYYKIYFDQEA